MPTPAQAAKAAIRKPLQQRDAARQKVAALDEQIEGLLAMMGDTPRPRAVLPPDFPPMPEPEPELSLPETPAAGDNMGPGRWI